jgi:hypothetical protein
MSGTKGREISIALFTDLMKAISGPRGLAAAEAVTDLMKAKKREISNAVAGATVDLVEAMIRGDVDPEFLRHLGEFVRDTFDGKYFHTPKERRARDEKTFLLLHDECCGKRGMTKAEFVRKVARMNELEPRTRQRGINGTDVKNLYRCLNDLLKKRRSKT